MPRRRLMRGLSGALAGLGEGIGNFGSMQLNNILLKQRQQELSTQNSEQALLNDYLQQIAGSITPEKVAELGPDRVRAFVDTRRRMLPERVRRMLPESMDLGGMDSSVDQKMAPVRRRIAEASSPEAVPGSDELDMLLRENRAPASQVVTGDQGISVDTTSDEFDRLLEMAQSKRKDLLAGQPKKATKYIDENGVERTRFDSDRELGEVGSLQTGLTSGQNAQREGAAAAARTQAEADVKNDPRNVKGFATAAAAQAYATHMAQLQADKKMGAGSFKPELHVYEDVDAAGNKVFKVGLKQLGAQFGTNTPTESVTDAMRQSYGFATKAAESHNQLLQIEAELAKRGMAVNWAAARNPDALKDPLTRQFVRAVNEFVNAQARRESGAAISETEWNRYMSGAGYMPGDDQTSLAAKQDARRRVIQGLSDQSGRQMGQQFVSVAELTAMAQAAGTTVQQEMQKAEAEGFKVVR